MAAVSVCLLCRAEWVRQHDSSCLAHHCQRVCTVIVATALAWRVMTTTGILSPALSVFSVLLVALLAGHKAEQHKVKPAVMSELSTPLPPLFPAKLAYFVILGAMAAYTPYVPVLLDEVGFSKAQIGRVRLVHHLCPRFTRDVAMLCACFAVHPHYHSGLSATVGRVR